jgi:orotidine-5'-phosphate decarboxylase
MCPNMPILIPGVGAQGGDLEASVLAGVDEFGEKAIIAVSRTILYAGEGRDYAVSASNEARALRNRINEARISR